MTEIKPLERNKWCCIGCGNLANAEGKTNCECPSGLLYLPSSPNQCLAKIEGIEEDIAKLQSERAHVLEEIRSKLP